MKAQLTTILTWGLTAGLAVLAGACNENESEEKGSAFTEQDEREKVAPGTADAPTDKDAAEGSGQQSVTRVKSVQEALSAYEAMRDALAKDEKKPIQDAANRLAKAARAASEDASGKTASELGEMTKAANGLAAKADADIEEIRKTFGELSRHLVRLVSENPDLQKGLHVFECPMAKGYKKWVQKSENLENPYMGQRMLECGVETKWESS